MALKIYCPGTDMLKEATQEDIDRLQRQLNILGSFFSNLQRAVAVTRDKIKATRSEEKENA